MSDPTSDVEEIIVMEHHDPEEALADLPLSVGTVLQLSVAQLREKLLELGSEPKGRPKPQLQLELLQILKCEIVAPEVKSTSLDQDQLQLQKEQLQLEMLRCSRLRQTLLTGKRELRNRKLRWSCKNEEISWGNNVSQLSLRRSYVRKLLRLSCVRRQLSNSDVERSLSNRNESVRSFSIRMFPTWTSC